MNDEIENAALTDENSEALTPAEKEALLIRQNALMYNFMGPIPGMYTGAEESAKAERLGYWSCSCGELNRGKFCTECGTKKHDT